MQINIKSSVRPVVPEWQEETLLNVLREQQVRCNWCHHRLHRKYRSRLVS